MISNDFRFSPPDKSELLPRVINQLGYPSLKEVDRYILREVERIIVLGKEKIEPGFLYRTCPLLGWGEGVLKGQDVRIRSEQWSKLVARLVEPGLLCCFVVTLGEEIDASIARMQEDSLFQAYLLDAVGSVLAEQMAGQAEAYLSEVLLAQEYQTTARFSPGYCDWETGEGQNALFGFLQPEPVGVRCTSSGMMIPQKSISACLVGAREVSVKTPCRSCSRTECPYRREGELGMKHYAS
jgi:hypothetical protein